MLRRSTATRTHRGPDDERHLDPPAEHVADLGHLVDDLVHGDGDPVGVEDLRDGAQPRGRRAETRTHDRRLRNRGVPNPVRPKFLVQSLRHPEGIATDRNITAHDDDGLIALHLFAHRFVQGLFDGDDSLHVSVLPLVRRVEVFEQLIGCGLW